MTGDSFDNLETCFLFGGTLTFSQLLATDKPGVRKVPGGSGEQRKMENTHCEVIRGVPTTPRG